MRPKKPILLYCPRCRVVICNSFCVASPSLRGYCHRRLCGRRTARGGSDAVFACCVLIHAQQGDLAGRLVHRILEVAGHMPLLLVDRAGDLAPVRYADMVLYGRNTSMQHILGALQTLCARKRGPQPRSAA